MPFAIYTQDKPGHAKLRAETRAAHIVYLQANVHRLIAAGGLLQDDGSPGEGGIIILDTDDRAEAERFVAEDPYTMAGLFQTVMISRWRKAFLQGECLL